MISAPTPAAILVEEEEPPSPVPALAPQPAEAPTAIPFRRLTALAATEQWQDWRWQMQNRIRSVAGLAMYFDAAPTEPGMTQAETRFPMAITPYYASLIRTMGPADPVYRMSIPQVDELFDPSFLHDDPLHEEHDMPEPGLVHRYHDRALLIATSACAMYCRHCTRKRVTGMRESCLSNTSLHRAVGYIAAHPEIHDVIISGGDPFTLTTQALERIVAAVRGVASVDIIRIGTRTPVTLPMRVTPELVNMLRRYQPVWVNTHFNHPQEVTPEAIEACTRLVDAGIPVGNQSVLLRGVNDDPRVMEQLCRALVRMRVRPYYLFQCDLVRGVEHFRTPLARGIEIMEYLRGRLSGLAIPSFVVDAPGGGGKIPVLPNYVVSMSPTHTVLRNFEGMLISYPEPWNRAHDTDRTQAVAASPTVYELATGRGTTIQPASSVRQNRRRSHARPCSHIDAET